MKMKHRFDNEECLCWVIRTSFGISENTKKYSLQNTLVEKTRKFDRVFENSFTRILRSYFRPPCALEKIRSGSRNGDCIKYDKNLAYLTLFVSEKGNLSYTDEWRSRKSRIAWKKHARVPNEKLFSLPRKSPTFPDFYGLELRNTRVHERRFLPITEF